MYRCSKFCSALLHLFICKILYIQICLCCQPLWLIKVVRMKCSTPSLFHATNNFIPVTAREAVETAVQNYVFEPWQVCRRQLRVSPKRNSVLDCSRWACLCKAARATAARCKHVLCSGTRWCNTMVLLAPVPIWKDFPQRKVKWWCCWGRWQPSRELPRGRHLARGFHVCPRASAGATSSGLAAGQQHFSLGWCPVSVTTEAQGQGATVSAGCILKELSFCVFRY